MHLALQMKKYLVFVFMLYIQLNAWASYLIIPMDDTQTNHLKAYGIAYWVLENQQEVDWLLNYRGGSFLIKNKSVNTKNFFLNYE